MLLEIRALKSFHILPEEHNMPRIGHMLRKGPWRSQALFFAWTSSSAKVEMKYEAKLKTICLGVEGVLQHTTKAQLQIFVFLFFFF